MTRVSWCHFWAICRTGFVCGVVLGLGHVCTVTWGSCTAWDQKSHLVFVVVVVVLLLLLLFIYTSQQAGIFIPKMLLSKVTPCHSPLWMHLQCLSPNAWWRDEWITGVFCQASLGMIPGRQCWLPLVMEYPVTRSSSSWDFSSSPALPCFLLLWWKTL